MVFILDTTAKVVEKTKCKVAYLKLTSASTFLLAGPSSVKTIILAAKGYSYHYVPNFWCFR